MNAVFIFIGLLIIQRLAELVIARRNERILKQRGAFEVGQDHYYLFILLHVAFFLSLCAETLIKQTEFITSFAWILWGIFAVMQVFRIWCIQSLGTFWNTKIIILPQSTRVKKGPYRLIAHPNYVIVAVELFIIPLLIQAYVTAILFPLLHILLLTIRIPAENKALRQLQS